MQQTNSSSNSFYIALLLSPAIFLAGCAPLDWAKGKMGGKPEATGEQVAGDTLVSMNGEVLITTNDLEMEFNQLLEDNPQLKSILPFMPDAKYNFMMGLLNQKIVDKYVADKKLDATAEYKKDLAQMEKSVTRMLNTKYFSAENPVQVTDADLQKFYDEHKGSMQELLISHGGVNAKGISFSKDADAQAFAAKAKEKGDFAKAAQEAGMSDKVRDFKLVNNQSAGVEPVVRAAILGLKKFPATEVVKAGDKTVWVVSASSKEEPTYRPFEQVKAGLEEYLKKQKATEVVEKKIGELKNEYKIVVNDDYFKPQQAENVDMAQATEGADDAQVAAAATAEPTKAA